MNKATSATGWARNPDGSLGYTWNPITGCLNGCPYCYARKLANTRLRARYRANDNLAPTPKDLINYSLDPFYPRFWWDRLVQPTDQQKPRGIFTCDMSDLFGIGIPEMWAEMVLLQIKRCPQHRFYLLTKQPQNLIKWSPFPDNCWVGVTVTANGDMTRALTNLAVIEARVKYLSIEPLLGAIGMNDHMSLKDAGVGWVIIGAQTKPTVYPRVEWVQEIVEAYDKAGIPEFLKDNLWPLLFVNNVLPIWARTPHSLTKLRQEVPK